MLVKPRLIVPIVVTLALLVAACGSQGSEAAAPKRPTGPKYDPGAIRFPSGAVPGSSACLAPDGQTAFVAWPKLRNPILQRSGPVTDPLLRWDNFRWRMLFSRRTESNGVAALGHTTSADFTDWTPFRPTVPDGWSPDAAQLADRFSVLVTDSSSLEEPGRDSLVYRHGQDLSQIFGPPATPLAPGIFPGEDVGDGALAVTERALYLVFSHVPPDRSRPPHAAVVVSSSGSLDGPWRLVGELDLGTFSDAQLLVIDGKWHLVGTTGTPPRPTLYRLDGDPARPESWRRWTLVRRLVVPTESWSSAANGADPARAPYLCDARRADGWFYLLYSGSTEQASFGGLGYQKIGVARSTDLKTWHVPPK